MTKSISLTRGKVAIVDDDDFEYLNQWKWCVSFKPATKSYYAIRGVWGNGKTKMVKMSRFIMNTPADMVCDHINHDTLDNRKSNLRNITISQNNMNKRRQSNNTTGVTGVNKNNGSFEARAWKNGKLHTKTFKSFDDAVCWREKLMAEVFGEFAYSEKG